MDSSHAGSSSAGGCLAANLGVWAASPDWEARRWEDAAGAAGRLGGS